MGSLCNQPRLSGAWISFRSVPPTAVPLSLNAGGPAVGTFLADTDFSRGNPENNNTSAVDLSLCGSLCAPAAVYQTGCYGTFTYTVRLHFSEDWSGDNYIG